MMAELNFVEDCFKVQAALAPTSFIYVPMARLHGGFALYSFFGKSPHAGDWVFTAGGYHRKFAVPAHYPRPDRLGLDFSIGIISIRGEGYFAITPKAVMAGAMIRCELSLGPVYAWLDAAFDGKSDLYDDLEEVSRADFHSDGSIRSNALLGFYACGCGSRMRYSAAVRHHSY